MGRTLKYGEATKVLRIRIPESKYEEFRKIALEYLEQFISKNQKKEQEIKMVFKDSYEILGVNRNSTEEEIKIAYKQLAKKYHPDLNKNSNAQEKFIELNNAYTELTKQEPPNIKDLMNAIFGEGWFGNLVWDVNIHDFPETELITEEFEHKGEIKKITRWNPPDIYYWASNKMGLLNKIFREFNNYLYYDYERKDSPYFMKLHKEVIEPVLIHLKKVLNKEEIERMPKKFVNPLKKPIKPNNSDYTQEEWILYGKKIGVYNKNEYSRKVSYNVMNQYHPKFINKFPEKYQSFIYEKIREMIIKLEEELKNFSNQE